MNVVNVGSAPEQFVVGDTPVSVALLLGGLTFLTTAIAVGALMLGELLGLIFFVGTILGVTAMYLFVRRALLVFDPEEGTLTVRRKKLGRGQYEVHQMKDVKHAVVENAGDLMRVSLLLNGERAGLYPVAEAFFNSKDQQDITESINRWLDSLRVAA